MQVSVTDAFASWNGFIPKVSNRPAVEDNESEISNAPGDDEEPKKGSYYRHSSKREDAVVKAQNREFDCRVGDCKEDLDGETPLDFFDFFFDLVHNWRPIEVNGFLPWKIE